MAPLHRLLLLAALLLLPAAGPGCLGAGFGAGAGGVDITKVLAGFPEFSTLSGMLTDTSVAMAIAGARDKVTLLAPNNTAIAAAFRVQRLPRSFLSDLLALHVLLDYLDAPRLAALQRGRAGEGSVVTTMLQQLRAPPRRTGFVRVCCGGPGRATFSSAAPGGPRNATFLRQVTAQPFSVAVLQVSGFIMPPGIRVPQPFPPNAKHMAAPPVHAPARAPVRAPAPAPGALPPVLASGPLVPSPIRPVPSPNLTVNPPPMPAEETEELPVTAPKLPSSAGHRAAASLWSAIAAAVAIGLTTCLHLHL